MTKPTDLMKTLIQRQLKNNFTSGPSKSLNTKLSLPRTVSGPKVRSTSLKPKLPGFKPKNYV